jgi:hypothetical protein
MNTSGCSRRERARRPVRHAQIVPEGRQALDHLGIANEASRAQGVRLQRGSAAGLDGGAVSHSRDFFGIHAGSVSLHGAQALFVGQHRLR